MGGLLPDGTLHEGSRGITLGRGRLGVAGTIDLALDEGDGVEVVSPHGRSCIWTRKQAGIACAGA